jgi:hypothetical protein
MKAKQQQQAHKNEATSAERPDPHVSIGAGWLIEEEESREARDKTVHARGRARGSERTNATQRNAQGAGLTLYVVLFARMQGSYGKGLISKVAM